MSFTVEVCVQATHTHKQQSRTRDKLKPEIRILTIMLESGQAGASFSSSLPFRFGLNIKWGRCSASVVIFNKGLFSTPMVGHCKPKINQD